MTRKISWEVILQFNKWKAFILAVVATFFIVYGFHEGSSLSLLVGYAALIQVLVDITRFLLR